MSRLTLWIPTVSMMLMSLISYIDRNTLALLAPTILKDTHLSKEQYGWIVTAFSMAYMAGNPVWGIWLDRYGLRRGLLASVSIWTLASAAHAFASGFWSFAAARLTLGFGEGATFPGGLRTVVQTLPPVSRARGVAVAYSGGSLGAVVTPIVITPIAAYWGWRGAFWFTGLIGLLWLMLWFVVGRMKIMSLPPAQPATETPSRPRLSDPRLWSYILTYAFGALPLGFILYISAIYLSTLGKTQVEIGKVLWIPPLGWEVGYFFWGWVTDRQLRRRGAGIATYRPLMIALTLMSLPLALVTRIGPYWLLMSELFFAMFITAGFVIVGVSYATSVYSSSHAGLIAGVGAGSWSALVGLVMPVVGRLFDQQRYETAFILATAFPVTGFLAWQWLNRRPA